MSIDKGSVDWESVRKSCWEEREKYSQREWGKLSLIKRLLVFLTSFYYKPKLVSYNVNGLCVLPVPLCMSSYFRQNFPAVVKPGWLADVVIVRDNEDRLLTAYKKKILAGQGFRKSAIVYRAGFTSLDPDEYVSNSIRLYDSPFFDFHWTPWQSFMRFAREGATVINISNVRELTTLEELLGVTSHPVNRSSQVLVNGK